jgi:hypothetical protein
MNKLGQESLYSELAVPACRWRWRRCLRWRQCGLVVDDVVVMVAMIVSVAVVAVVVGL